MSKVILRCEKIKTKNAFTKMYKHNFRTDYCENIDKSRSYMNEELVILPEEETYKSVFEQKIKSSEYYKDHKIRSNAVLGIDVQIGFSRDEMQNASFDIDAWKRQAIKWTKDTFGKDNVISMVLHMDESTPHIHAVVIPMIDGKLNCSEFLGSPEKMRGLQDTIGEYMSEVGLERGGRRSIARHTDIQEFYGALNSIMEKELPPAMEGENIEEYHIRMQKIYKKLLLKMFGQEKEAQAKIESLQGSVKAVEDLESKNKELEIHNERLRETLERAKVSISNAQKNQRIINAIIYAVKNGIPSQEEARLFYDEMMKIVNMSEKIQKEKAVEENKE